MFLRRHHFPFLVVFEIKRKFVRILLRGVEVAGHDRRIVNEIQIGLIGVFDSHFLVLLDFVLQLLDGVQLPVVFLQQLNMGPQLLSLGGF